MKESDIVLEFSDQEIEDILAQAKLQRNAEQQRAQFANQTERQYVIGECEKLATSLAEDAKTLISTIEKLRNATHKEISGKENWDYGQTEKDSYGREYEYIKINDIVFLENGVVRDLENNALIHYHEGIEKTIKSQAALNNLLEKLNEAQVVMKHEVTKDINNLITEIKESLPQQHKSIYESIDNVKQYKEFLTKHSEESLGHADMVFLLACDAMDKTDTYNQAGMGTNKEALQAIITAEHCRNKAVLERIGNELKNMGIEEQKAGYPSKWESFVQNPVLSMAFIEDPQSFKEMLEQYMDGFGELAMDFIKDPRMPFEDYAGHMLIDFPEKTKNIATPVRSEIMGDDR